MKLEHLSLVLGLTKTELKRRLELGLIDPQILNRQVSEYSESLKLDALCDSLHEKNTQNKDSAETLDRYQVRQIIYQNKEQLDS